ncbi:MAG: choice-of-anchor Q domain-containing protein [Paludibacter sp.]|nr:choice-of-anchor Q domain-containing protein [Paludibacter sp.]
MKKLKLLFVIFLFVSHANAATVYYVSQTGNNSTGLTWSNAYNSIQTALTAATNGDQVWVAQGTYVIDNEETQLLIKEGINVYGGFSGSETTLESRSTNPALTIISHKNEVAVNFRLLFSTDLNEPTTWDGFTFDGKNVGSGVKLSGNCTLNNCIIKNCMSINGSGAAVYMSSSSDFIPVTLNNSDLMNNKIKVSTDNTFQLGGAAVYVKSGSKMAEISNCNITNNTIEGISASGALEGMGAGIYIYEGIIRNCVLNENHITNSANPSYNNNNFTGGAIAIVPEKVDVAANTVLIEGCVITNSTSNSRGGAVIIDPRWSGQYHGNYTISKTIIANNKTNVVGGGIFATAATAQTGDGFTLNIINSVIANNTAQTNAGGGIHLNVGCVLNITNSTIVKNLAGNYGGGGIFMQGTANHTIKATLKNVLLWGNEATGRQVGERQLRVNAQAATIIFSGIQEYNKDFAELSASTLGDNLALDISNTATNGPAFVAPSTTAGYGAADALTANWRLSAGSVCIDAGDDYISDDIAGVARPQGDYSDIGAYEYSTTSGVNSKQDQNLIIYGTQGRIVFENELNIKQIEVYSTHGTLIKTQQVFDGTNYIEIPSNQLYIVKAGDMIKKIIVR